MSESPVRRCAHCSEPVKTPDGGRPRRFCSAACKQSAYRARRAAIETHLPKSPTAAQGVWRKTPRSCRARPILRSRSLRPVLHCPLLVGHQGSHRALVGNVFQQRVTLWWVGWENEKWGWGGGWQGDSPAGVLYYACDRCVLPRRHAGVCLHAAFVWEDPGYLTTRERELDQVVRQRLSFPASDIAVPRWYPVGQREPSDAARRADPQLK